MCTVFVFYKQLSVFTLYRIFIVQIQNFTINYLYNFIRKMRFCQSKKADKMWNLLILEILYCKKTIL